MFSSVNILFMVTCYGFMMSLKGGGDCYDAEVASII